MSTIKKKSWWKKSIFPSIAVMLTVSVVFFSIENSGSKYKNDLSSGYQKTSITYNLSSTDKHLTTSVSNYDPTDQNIVDDCLSLLSADPGSTIVHKVVKNITVRVGDKVIQKRIVFETTKQLSHKKDEDVLIETFVGLLFCTVENDGSLSIYEWKN